MNILKLRAQIVDFLRIHRDFVERLQWVVRSDRSSGPEDAFTYDLREEAEKLLTEGEFIIRMWIDVQIACDALDRDASALAAGDFDSAEREEADDASEVASLRKRSSYDGPQDLAEAYKRDELTRPLPETLARLKAERIELERAVAFLNDKA